jgi:WD40 repeat protein
LAVVLPASAEEKQAPAKLGVNNILKLKREIPLKSPAGRIIPTFDVSGTPHPQVVFHKGRIEFLDAAGSVAKQVVPPAGCNLEAHAGKNRKLIGAQIARCSQVQGRRVLGQYFVFDQVGNQRLHIKNLGDLAFSPPSPSGDYVIGWPGHDTPGGPPVFFDAAGPRKTSTEGWPNGFTVNDVTFSPNGRYAAVRASKGIETATMFFDSKGNQLWTYGGDGAVAFSPVGAWVAIADQTGTHLFSIKGQKLRDIPTSGDANSTLQVSTDGKSFLLAKANGSVSRVDAAQGNILWEKDLMPAAPPSAKSRILAMNATGDLSTFVLLSLTSVMVPVQASDGSLNRMRKHTDSSMMLFDGMGSLVDKVSLLPDEVAALSDWSDLELSTDGQTIFVPGKSAPLIYSKK